MKKRPTQFLVAAIGVVVAIQFVPTPSRDAPATAGESPLAPPIGRVFRQSCFDCHSYQTRWPWYSRVAPISWLIAHDVGEGREKLNFSLWSALAANKRKKAVEEIWEAVSGGEMPLGIYTLVHGAAALSDADRAAIEEWVRSQGVDPAAIDRENGGGAPGGDDDE